MLTDVVRMNDASIELIKTFTTLYNMDRHQSAAFAARMAKSVLAAVCAFFAISANAQDAKELQQKLQHTSDKN